MRKNSCYLYACVGGLKNDGLTFLPPFCILLGKIQPSHLTGSLTIEALVSIAGTEA
jgi:hypothetical protein